MARLVERRLAVGSEEAARHAGGEVDEQERFADAGVSFEDGDAACRDAVLPDPVDRLGEEFPGRGEENAGVVVGFGIDLVAKAVGFAFHEPEDVAAGSLRV